MSTESCALCDKPTSSRHTPIRCKLCKKRFHVKCAKINSNQFRDLTDRGVDWHCDQCFNDIFPLASLDTYETFDFFNNSNPSTHPPPPPPPRNTRCSICPGKKKIKRTPDSFAFCRTCSKYSHLGCSNLKSKNLPLPPEWLCPLCTTESLPFSSITNDDFLLTLNGCDAKTTDFLKDVPTFSIQSLIGQLPGENFDTDDFISDTVE